MADVNPQRDFEIVTTRLDEIAAAARATRAPFLVHLNGGRWAGGGPLMEHLGRDLNIMAWDQLDRPWRYLVDGEYHFSLSLHNESYRRYKERNLQAAARWLAAFADRARTATSWWGFPPIRRCCSICTRTPTTTRWC